MKRTCSPAVACSALTRTVWHAQGLTGAIHETGHALYEQGRNLDYDGLPVNEARLPAPDVGSMPGVCSVFMPVTVLGVWTCVLQVQCKMRTPA